MLEELAVKHLCKKIGLKNVLSDINLTLGPGELVVLTGPNGAGKTTLMRLIAGLIKKSSGEILWNGKPYGLGNTRIGYMGHRPMLYETMTVYENLEFFGKLYGLFSGSRVEGLLKRVGLYLYRYEPVSDLSRGMQQRLTLARMLIHDPELLLYDEPFTGLDTEGQELLRGILKEKQEAARIQILITHKTSILTGIDYREVKLKAGKVVELNEANLASSPKAYT